MNTYAFPNTPDATNIAERHAIYTTVADGSARDARARNAALAQRERDEIARCRRENAGRMSAFWARQLVAPAAPPML